MTKAEDRTQSRDLCGLGFLAGTYRDCFSTERIPRAEEISSDYESPADRCRPAFKEVLLLRDRSTAEERALIFRIAIIEQMHHRGLSIVEQPAPGTRAVLRTHVAGLLGGRNATSARRASLDAGGTDALRTRPSNRGDLTPQSHPRSSCADPASGPGLPRPCPSPLRLHP